MKNKNIFVLPTTEPSQIYLIINENALGWTSKNPESMEHYGSGTHNQHVYITKKEPYDRGDWCIDVEAEEIFKVAEVKEYSGIVRSDTDTYVYDACVKIALTTDLKLIADGVQAIDNEFLQWFVKNSSCEEVRVEKEKIILGEVAGTTYTDFNYKIIIPKEEPKKEYQTCKCGSNWLNTTDKPFCFKCGESVKEDFKPTEETCTCTDECLGYLTKTCKGIETLEQIDQNNPVTRGSTALVYKQETLEEANWKVLGTKTDTFYNGAKWQQERSYSDEEVIDILVEFSAELKIISNITKWFEKYKKK